MDNKIIPQLDAVEQQLIKSGDTSYNMALRFVQGAKESLAIVNSPADYQHGRDVLMTAEHYFKMRNASLMACNTLAIERLRIEHTIGAMLIDDDEIHRGGSFHDGRATLESKYGINRWQAQRYKKIGSIHPDDLQAIFDDILESKGEVSSSRVSGMITQWFDGPDDRKHLHWSVFTEDALNKLQQALNATGMSDKVRGKLVLIRSTLYDLHTKEGS